MSRPDYLGLRSWVRTSHGFVGVYDGRLQGLDTDGGRWYTICEAHATAVCHRTLALARAHSHEPEEWCEGTTDEPAASAPTANEDTDMTLTEMANKLEAGEPVHEGVTVMEPVAGTSGPAEHIGNDAVSGKMTREDVAASRAANDLPAKPKRGKKGAADKLAAKREALIAAERRRIEREDADKLKAARRLGATARKAANQAAADVKTAQKVVERGIRGILTGTATAESALADAQDALAAIKPARKKPVSGRANLAAAAHEQAVNARPKKPAAPKAHPAGASEAVVVAAAPGATEGVVLGEGQVVVHVPTGRNHLATLAANGQFILACWTRKPVNGELVESGTVECPRCLAKLAAAAEA